jgi:hypothetical protein
MVQGAAVLAVAAMWFGPNLGVCAPAGGSSRKYVEIILDASGSMRGRLPGGEAKIVAAKKAVAALVPKLPPSIVLAFRAYGHQSPTRRKDCRDTQLLVPFGPAARTGPLTVAAAKKLRAQGYTPITYVLTLAAKDFPAAPGAAKVIVLVSDGIETCKGDPCALALALKKAQANLVIHTVGFGVGAAARSQLKCIARVSGGRYFPAGSARELAGVIGAAIKTRGLKVKPKKGVGRLQVKGADLSGHRVIDAVTGRKVTVISRIRTTVKLPAGIYNVKIGRTWWKSVRVETGRTTVLTPGWVKVVPASIRGHYVLQAETGQRHGSVSASRDSVALMPGEYLVMFGRLKWPVKVEPGRMTVIRAGVLTVKGARITGHAVRDVRGNKVGSVSATMNWLALPPGDYTVELVRGKPVKFTLTPGRRVEFQAP